MPFSMCDVVIPHIEEAFAVAEAQPPAILLRLIAKPAHFLLAVIGSFISDGIDGEEEGRTLNRLFDRLVEKLIPFEPGIAPDLQFLTDQLFQFILQSTVKSKHQ